MSDAPAPTTPPSPEPSTGEVSRSGGVRDTLESVLIALILAFVFRAFFVEAFVIPTGSMATTLYGAHMRFRCEDCGYHFTTNYQTPQVPGSDDIAIPPFASVLVRERGPNGAVRDVLRPQVFAIHCPNCGYRVPRNLPNDPDNDATAPPVHYGDRILVLKYGYLLSPPQRWDVVVFKSPYDQRDSDPPPGRPVTAPEFQQNYIKRLVGLPGEELMLLDGDVYVRPARPAGTTPDERSERAFDPGGWVVQTKPRHVQNALWRLVHDNDHQPRGLPRSPDPDFSTPWVTPPGAGAFRTEPGGRVFVSEPGTSAAIRFDPDANRRTHALRDFLVFNVTAEQQAGGRNPDQFNFVERDPEYVVTDLQLRVTWEKLEGPGDAPLRLTLSKRDQRFVAELTDTTASLLRVWPDGRTETLSTTSIPRGARRELVFENVDYRVALRVNGREVLATTPQQYAPDVVSLYADDAARRQPPLPEVGIEARGHAARLSHLSLWRDVYYSNRTNQIGHKNPLWGHPDQPIVLARGSGGRNEYFVLGDNSPLSLDARFWDDPIRLPWEDLFVPDGRVPERFLLGKAFYVYWPAGYRPAFLNMGIRPNFGDMRMIH